MKNSLNLGNIFNLFNHSKETKNYSNLKFCIHLLYIFWVWFHCQFVFLSLIQQNCQDLLKVEPNLCSETRETSCDGNEDIIVRVESTGEQHEEEDPLLISFPAIKSEHKVSCTYVISHVRWPCCGAIQCQVNDGLTSGTASLWTPTLSETVLSACLVKNRVLPGDIVWILVRDISLLPRYLVPDRF
jgi:hypothetical protein